MGNGFSKILPLGQREPQVKVAGPIRSPRSMGAQQEGVLDERLFHSMLTLERRRADRSRKPHVLMLLDANLENGAAEGLLKEAIEIIIASKRETDLIGWYRLGTILGVIFTEVTTEGDIPLTETLRTKFQTAFSKHMGKTRASRIAISLHTEG